MADTLEQLAERIKSAFADAKSSLAFGELTVAVDSSEIVPFVTWLRDDPEMRFEILIDICGVDYPNRARRFDVVYHLLSLAKNRRIRVKVETDETTPVPSSFRFTLPPTGSSAKPSTCTASCSRIIPICAASSPITVSPAIRCARIFRSPAMSRCATTTSRNASSMSRFGWSRNSAISISSRPGRARPTSCPGDEKAQKK